MAVSPNLGLYLPTRDDYISVKRDLSDNYEIIDTAVHSQSESIENIEDGLAIVANGNVHAAIGAGQFVYVKGHDTLADGLYTNTSGSTINANATLSSSNLTANASGGLNSLSEAIANRIIKYNTALSIPASGSNSGIVACTGLTADHELIRWNFSSSAENNPPANLVWETGANYFKISNTGGTTSETIKPVFALPTKKTS